MKQDWHQCGRRLQQAEQGLKASTISDANKEAILAFKRQLVVEGLSAARILTYVGKLRRLAVDLEKDFKDCGRDDVMRMIEAREQAPLSEWTKQAYRVVLKRFFKWLRQSDEYPPEVKWIKAGVRKDRLKLPGDGDIYTAEEIQALIRAAGHPRDKALVATLYESGCRIGEIATMAIRDVSFERVGCRLNVMGKTGARPVLVINAASYLANWINMHPSRDNRDAPLWVNVGSTAHGSQMTYTGIRRLLDRCFERTALRKRRNPHLFRHTRASHLAPALSEYQLNSMFGWRHGSPQAATYVHLSGKSTDGALLKLNGIAQEEDKREQALKPRKCPRCDNINPQEYQFCGKCGCTLDLKAALEHEEKQKETMERRAKSDDVLNLLMEDAEVRELLKKKLTTLDA